MRGGKRSEPEPELSEPRFTSSVVGLCFGLVLLFLLLGCGSSHSSSVYTIPDQAAAYPGFLYQGEYAGLVRVGPDAEPVRAGLQVAVYGKNRFYARLYYGGLPGDAATNDVFDLEGRVVDDAAELAGEGVLKFRGNAERLVALDEENNELGQLERVRRESPTLGMKPPDRAVVLFDGSNLGQWSRSASISKEGWLEEGATTVGKFGDFRLHVEARLPFMPESEDQQRGNSGLYIQKRYEVQILDSFARPLAINGNGALYREAAPSVNASYPPLTWQTYDVFFRAPRFGPGGRKTENARITVFLNGVLVHDDVELAGGTGLGGFRREVPRGELYLQDHSDPVRFRNVWLLEEEYSPPETEYQSRP